MTLAVHQCFSSLTVRPPSIVMRVTDPPKVGQFARSHLCNPSTLQLVQVQKWKKTIILQKASKQWLHLQRKSPTNRFLFLLCFQLFSPLFSSGRATRPGGTSQEGRCSSLPPTGQRTGVQDCNSYRTHVYVHGVRSLGPGVSKSHWVSVRVQEVFET